MGMGIVLPGNLSMLYSSVITFMQTNIWLNTVEPSPMNNANTFETVLIISTAMRLKELGAGKNVDRLRMICENFDSL